MLQTTSHIVADIYVCICVLTTFAIASRFRQKWIIMMLLPLNILIVPGVHRLAQINYTLVCYLQEVAHNIEMVYRRLMPDVRMPIDYSRSLA